MALRALRSSQGLLQATRYSLSSSPPVLNLPRSLISSLSEQSILEELSELLPINPKPLNPRPINQKPVSHTDLASVSDGFLSPAEKLRGVFLQNLTGRFAIDSALSSTGVDLNLEVFADVVDRGSLGGAPMVLLLDWALKQPKISKCVEIYNVVLKALGRRKFFTFVEEVLTRMKADEIKPDLETIDILIDSFVSARRVSKAMEMFERLEEIGSKCDTESLTIIMRSLCRRSHIRVANSLFNKMKGRILYDGVLYNEIIGGWARFGRVDKVETFWATMVDDGFDPDKVTFSHLIEALGRAGQIDDAVNVFEKMEREGCCRHTVHYNAMISNYISVGDLDECLKYYKCMSQDGCLPDRDTYEKLISAFIKVRRVADALELFDEMLSRGICPSTGMVTSFVKPLCSFGPPHAAMVIYKKSRKAGCKISLKAYKLLLLRLSRFGKCGTVLKLWEEMQKSGHTSDKEVYEYIVDGLCNIGRLDSAVLVVEESLRKGFCLGKVVYSKLNNKLLEMNKVETAYKLFLKVKDARVLANSQSSVKCSKLKRHPHKLLQHGSKSCFKKQIFLSYMGIILLLASVFYLILIKEKLSVGSISSTIMATLFAKFFQYKSVKKETVLIMPAFGVQLESHFWSGRVNRRFVPLSKILKPVINECVTPVTCYWSLALILRGDEELTIVFQEFRPPVKMLIPVWKALCKATTCKENSIST
ncbi:hypothetical protein J5N97_014746 [Dioscorea zingiberensis]|uniref:Phosphatidylinositol N-acetylglucosaminyltransferase subunit H conserved domain-containing protein n=1 Tax=Dioscorea zingiberensis TaxID=325984 RepID=A0A9D5CV83_9LILI|nr:hypothetical protein J5N97_014746 [Dioscorea zingiberensis]